MCFETTLFPKRETSNHFYTTQGSVLQVVCPVSSWSGLRIRAVSSDQVSAHRKRKESPAKKRMCRFILIRKKSCVYIYIYITHTH